MTARPIYCLAIFVGKGGRGEAESANDGLARVDPGVGQRQQAEKDNEEARVQRQLHGERAKRRPFARPLRLLLSALSTPPAMLRRRRRR